MKGLNKVQLIGNVGKDPELKTFENGKSVCKFSIATNESYRDSTGNSVDKTQWHNIVIWGTLGDSVSKYIKKGDPVYLEGKIETREYEGKYYTEIICFNVIMLGKKESQSAAPPQPAAPPQQQKPDSAQNNIQDVPSDDLPF